jgi:hypothetical protein
MNGKERLPFRFRPNNKRHWVLMINYPRIGAKVNASDKPFTAGVRPLSSKARGQDEAAGDRQKEPMLSFNLTAK